MHQTMLQAAIAVVFAFLVFPDPAVPQPGSGVPDSALARLLAGGHYRRAQAMAEPRLAANPRDTEALYTMSRVRAIAGDGPRAVALAEQALAIEANSSRYQHQLATALGVQMRNASMFSAMSTFRRFQSTLAKAIDLDPANLDARADMVAMNLLAPSPMGSIAEAKRQADEMMKRDRVRGLMALSDIAAAEKNPAAAEAYLEQAVAGPVRYEARVKIAGYYAAEARAQYGKAMEHATAAIALDPSRIGAYSVLAATYGRQSRWADLDRTIAQAEQNVPDDRLPHFTAAVRMTTARIDARRAEQLLRRYLEQEPEYGAPAHSRAHWRLGQALELQGQTANAIAEMESALRLEPSLQGAKDDLKRLRK